MKNYIDFTLVLLVVFIYPTKMFGQDSGGNLCGPGIKEVKPSWILRFEILDQETRTPVDRANIKIISEPDSHCISWVSDRKGVAVLIVTDTRCIPDTGTIEITHPEYRYDERKIEKWEFFQNEDERRILLEGHMHNWTYHDAFPSEIELINKVRDRRYRVGVKQVPSEFGFNWPNYAPALFEYRVELQSLHHRQPRYEDTKRQPNERKEHSDIEIGLQWARDGLVGLRWGMSIDKVGSLFKRKINIFNYGEVTQVEMIGTISWLGRHMELPKGGWLVFKNNRLGSIYLNTINQEHDPTLIGDMTRVFGEPRIIPHPNYPPNGKIYIWEDGYTLISIMDFGEGKIGGIQFDSESINPWGKIRSWE